MKIVITQQDAYEPPPLAAGSGTLPAIVTPATATKVTFNAQGLVTASASLDAADVAAALSFAPYDGVANPLGFASAASLLPPIVAPGTATKVTFSAAGLITGSAALAAADIAAALGFAPYNGTANPLGFITAATGLPAIVAPGTASKVTFSAQGLITGSAALAAADIGAALGFVPYNGTANPLGFLTSAPALPSIVAAGTASKVTFNSQGLITGSAALAAADIAAALGFAPYDGAANPLGFITAATGLPAIVAPGTAIKVTFSAQGLITGSAALAASDVTAALGFTPYNGTANPQGFVTGAALAGLATTAQLAAATSGLIGSQLTTTDATPTPLTLPQPAAGLTAGRVVWCLTAQDAGSGDVAIFDAVAAFKRVTSSGPLLAVGTPEVTGFAADASMAGCTAAFAVGAGLGMTVTGVAGRQIAWQVAELGAL